MSLTVGTLVDTSGFTPGAPVAAPAPGTPSTGSPGTSVPGAPGTRAPGTVLTPAPGRQLPRTGASALLAAVALAMVGSAFALRRRNEALAVDEA
jgi:LPXTG-motif cell wall-anchored protein